MSGRAGDRYGRCEEEKRLPRQHAIIGRCIHPINSLSFVPHTKTKSTFTYTHLEGNGQLWQIDGPGERTAVSIVIDPLASQLDFGIPWGYRANKKALSETETIHLICDAHPSHCLLTMGLDDHTHLPTIQKLMARMPDLRYVVAPSCLGKIRKLGLRHDRITVLDHGQSCTLSECVTITSTRGALVGPPWQKRENGYLVKTSDLSIYYEPHGDVVLDDIKTMRANILVSPVTKQSIPAQVPPQGQFTLVYGGDRTLQIAETLHASVIVPLGNGALDIEGPLSGLVSASGDVSDFVTLVERRNANKRVGDDDMIVTTATPGVPLTMSI